jgi:hypothetical protein
MSRVIHIFRKIDRGDYLQDIKQQMINYINYWNNQNVDKLMSLFDKSQLRK